MTTKLLVLFLAPLLSGLAIFLVPKGRRTNFRMLLVFAGSYLFAITVIHILPELYEHAHEFELVGLFVLAGFFLQQFLEYFTSGVEHGHLHGEHGNHDHGHNHNHHHRHVDQPMSALVLLFALCIHAFLEGGMLAAPTFDHSHIYDVNAILFGIALHRAPAAFALMTVLTFQMRRRREAIPHLVFFSLAAPIGLLLSTYLTELEILSSTGMIYLYALVSGNFLHISTTIVFESTPEHRFNARKLAIAVVGALAAVITEYVI